MPLVALIGAYHESAGGVLHAALPLAGRSVIERQAHLAAAAGAATILVLTEKEPVGDLAAALARLESDGLPMRVVCGAEAAAACMLPSDPVLLIADGLIPRKEDLDAAAGADGKAVLTVPDADHGDPFERIDAGRRWAGVAMLDGRMVKETAAMLGDWDPQSTLVRRAVQEGAELLAAAPDAEGARLISARGEGSFAAAEEELLARSDAAPREWVSRVLLAPIERRATIALMPTPLTPLHARIAEVVLIVLAAFCLAAGWLLPGLAVFLLSTPLDGIARRLSALRLGRAPMDAWLSAVVPAAAAAALLLLGQMLSADRGWGCFVLAVLIILALLARHGERLPADADQAVFAERKGLAWLLLPFAALGLWTLGLWVLAGYAAASFFLAQREARRPERISEPLT